MLTILGIPNCDTVKKARTYFEETGTEFQFRDLRKQPLTQAEWENLLSQDPEMRLINTRGPSFRKTGLKKEELNADTALAILMENPSVMKRPAYVADEKLLGIGFKNGPLFFD